MRLHNAIKNKLFDIRLRDKFVAEGKLSKEEVDNYLASLESNENNFVPIDFDAPITNVSPSILDNHDSFDPNS